jgi:hypothetical protein
MRHPVRVMFVNGPPRCGKDTAVNALVRDLGGVPLKLAQPLREAVPAMFQMDLYRWTQALEQSKEDPCDDLCGMSPRAAMIWLSELVMKPAFGVDVFGQIAARRIVSTSHQHQSVFWISDCGFDAEMVPIGEAVGWENTALLQIDRPGCDFSNDSRSYVRRPAGMSSENHFLVHNGATVDQFESAVVRVARGWQIVSDSRSGR